MGKKINGHTVQKTRIKQIVRQWEDQSGASPASFLSEPHGITSYIGAASQTHCQLRLGAKTNIPVLPGVQQTQMQVTTWQKAAGATAPKLARWRRGISVTQCQESL